MMNLTHASLSEANFSFHRGAEVIRLPVVSAAGCSAAPVVTLWLIRDKLYNEIVARTYVQQGSFQREICLAYCHYRIL